MLSGTDLLEPSAVADPYPLLNRLRAESPVVWAEKQRAFLVLRHDDLTAALGDPRLSSDRVRPIYEKKLTPQQREERAPTYDLLEHWMVFNDPPNHTRLRKLVRAAFTVKAVRRLEPRVVAIVDELLDGLDDRRGDEVDLITEFSYLIPAAVIAEMMGVPRADVPRFKDWSDSVMTIVFGVAREPGVLAAAQQGLVELRDYLTDLARHYREHPAPNLVSDLAAAVDDDDRLTLDEIVATCVLLLFGGHETTTNLIGNGSRALLRHPDQRSWFLEHPDQVGAAVEELLRYDGPSKLEVRRCVETHERRGVTIPAEAQVYLVQLAANRDPEAFADPDRLDLARTDGRHVTFGHGIHYCLGAPIARLEGTIALERLHRRFPTMAEGPTDPVWHPTLVSRGMSSFPVVLER
ncbi:cytochrome P450 [Actinomycetospora sp. TBRC 11914]|uniref:cytochrome P450 n=1 Tax=Actinomycetospora sp. TBRC 11914 TaxID=2729387 RepID=UPI00145CE6EA|nr:cytochrome P450 [Actinomycetospora sp. TBRC 11914]NMO88268.1 cytochrome P450 [Actinomycetospora sp. TBRC 11914]